MPEEAQAPETPDTPTEAVPTEETPRPVVDYESRYNNLRPDYDRKSQRLAELEDWYAQAQAPQEPEDDDYEYDYEDSVARQEIAELKALLSQRDEETRQQQEAEREVAFINSEIKTLASEQEEDFTEEEVDAIGILSERYRTEDGKPDVARAYEHLFGKIVKPRREKYVSTKKASRPRSGSAAAQSIDLDDPKARRDYMTRKLQELEGDD